MPVPIQVQLTSFTSPDVVADRPFADKAIAVIASIVNNVDFQNRVFTAEYSRRLFEKDDYAYIEGTNELVLDTILTGKESRTIPNEIIELQVKLDKLSPGTIGSMRPPKPLITTNTLFFYPWKRKNDPVSLAAHWIHEWLHVAGFRHASDDIDPDDVNYLVGTIAVTIGRSLPIFKRRSEKNILKLGQGYLDASKIQGNCAVTKSSGN